MEHEQANGLVLGVLHELAPEVDLAAADRAARLSEELDLDSFGFLALVEALHDRAGLEVPERDYPLLSSLDTCVDYVAEHAG